MSQDGAGEKEMSDFVQKANVKRSVRTITTPIADVATLNTLVQDVIDTNAFQCVDHIVAGVDSSRRQPWFTVIRDPCGL